MREQKPYEYRLLLPDGEVRWVVARGEAVFAEVDGAERAVRYVGTLQDITERKRAVEALSLSESRCGWPPRPPKSEHGTLIYKQTN